jgi:threonine/homoserine/homoserine lactone efflux protein
MSLGVFYLFFKKVHVHPEDISLPPLKASDHTKLAIQGFLLNTLNPAVIIFWLTAATTLAATHSFNQRMVIFGTCLCVNISADIGKVFLAHKLRSKLTVHNIRIINKISGLILLLFGAAIIGGVFFMTRPHH